MTIHEQSAWKPVSPQERYWHIDVMRGLALFGVLIVNELSMYRVPLLEHILLGDAPHGQLDILISKAVASVVEFKALTIFSFLFGTGLAIQSERGNAGQASVTQFLIRRLLALGVIGTFHMVVISNVDILALYAVCGLLLLPVLRITSKFLVILGACLIFIPELVSFGPNLPSGTAATEHIMRAREVYSTGGFELTTRFRFYEIGFLILPLLAGILPRTLGLMMWGVVAWRSGVLRQPRVHRRTLTIAFICSTAAALLITHSALVWASSYVCGFLLLLPRLPKATLSGVAAVGKMALTNYLLQSIVMGLLFYGYGLGLSGRTSIANATAIAIALYAIQMEASRRWLVHFRFGPVEWLWRSLAYREWQPMKTV